MTTPTDERVPVTVITGFLGSGKTTLVNRILTEQHGRRIAVIENEFGEVGIDDALVLDAEEEIFEMNNGCICCTVRGDLIRILGALMRRRDRFDQILIETTGLADPAPVAQTFFVDDEIRDRLRLDAIVTMVDAAHERGMKVFFDIITNHTADVIQYAGGDYAYRSKADYPFSTLGGPEGERINPDFAGDDDHSPENWAKLTDPRFAYTPVVPEAERDIKVPAWLNDPIYYHNRGNSEWWGESAVYGDFAGLDDLATEHPRVLAGMIDIFGSWIDRFGIDGYRIDTAKHVNPEFWRAFIPAIRAHAAARGIPNFHIFGEVATASVAEQQDLFAELRERDGYVQIAVGVRVEGEGVDGAGP